MKSFRQRNLQVIHDHIRISLPANHMSYSLNCSLVPKVFGSSDHRRDWQKRGHTEVRQVHPFLRRSFKGLHDPGTNSAKYEGHLALKCEKSLKLLACCTYSDRNILCIWSFVCRYSAARHRSFSRHRGEACNYSTYLTRGTGWPVWFNMVQPLSPLMQRPEVGVGLRCGATSWQIHKVTWSQSLLSDIGSNTKQFKSRDASIIVMFLSLLLYSLYVAFDK